MEPSRENIGRIENVPILQNEAKTSLENFPRINPEVTPEVYQNAARDEIVASQVIPVLPQPVVQGSQSNDQSIVSSSNPLTANDDDLIEKEWVDKAKTIIAETKNDPYLREKRINELQIEYIRLRYGREIGKVNE